MLRRLLTVLCLTIVSAAGGEEVVSGTFELVDHRGATVTEASYDGRLRLVFFGFTRCPDVCPTTLLEVRSALGALGDKSTDVETLFISIDTAHDDPESLAEYVGAFHPSITGLTGTEAQVAAAAEAFNVTYGGTAASGGDGGLDDIYHTAYVFLMDRDGSFADVFGYGTRGARIADRVRELL